LISERTLINVPRTATITDQQIIEAAREVFLEFGFGAPSSEIARRAGVSEGTIFKRFRTKEDLFIAAVGLPDGEMWFEKAEALIGRGDLRQNLIELSLEMFNAAREVMPRIFMVISRGNAPMNHPNGTDSPMNRAMDTLTRLFAAEIRLGRMRQINPESAALMLLGALMHRVQLEVMFSRAVIDPSDLVTDVIDAFWQGIQPQ
jgi:AcrR family transcriptional regulator